MPSRISTAQIYDSGQAQVGNARIRETNTAEKATTLKEINRPSDNPGDWTLANSLKEDLSLRDGLVKDAQLGSNVLTATDTALSQMQQNVQRLQELAISVSGEGPQVSGLRKFVLGEVKSIYDGTIQLANTRFGERAIFSGLKTQSAAFDLQGNYLGDSNSLEVEISRELKVPMNLTGDRALLGKGLERGVNLFETMHRLISGLENEDTATIEGTLDDISQANNQMSYMRAEVGARLSSVKNAVDTQQENKVQATDAISKLEDADSVKVFSDLARDQAVLKSALSTTQKILQENSSDVIFR